MKKNISVIFAVILSVVIVHAEPYPTDAPLHNNDPHSGDDKDGWGIRFKVHGATFSTGKTSVHNNKFTTRSSWGIFKEWNFAEMWGGQVFGQYAGQGMNTGAKFGITGTRFFTQQERDLLLAVDYLVLGGTLRFYPEKRQKICLYIGPWFGLRLGIYPQVFHDGREMPWKNKEWLKELIKKDFERIINRFNWGILPGVEYQFDNGLLLGFDFNIGLVNISGAPSIKWYTYSLGLTLSFNFAKPL